MDQVKTRVVRYDADSSRIQHGDEIVAMALRLANGRWGLYDTEERRLTKATFSSPDEVAEAFDRNKAKGS